MNMLNPGGNMPPSYPRDMANVWKEFRKLWKRVDQPVVTNPVEHEVAWSFSGVLTDSDPDVQSPRWPVPCNIRITSVTTTISVLPGGGSMETQMDVGNVIVATFTDSPAQNINLHNFQLPVPAGSLIGMRWTTATAGVANVGILMRYVRVT